MAQLATEMQKVGKAVNSNGYGYGTYTIPAGGTGGSGGYAPDPAMMLNMINANSMMTSEMWGTLSALVAIALGLSRRQAQMLNLRLYNEVRGKTIEEKYDAIIALAYDVKETFPDE